VEVASSPPPSFRFRNRNVSLDPQALAPVAIAALAFAMLFFQPLVSLAKDWWELPEAGHGLLLAPIAVWLAWKSGRHKDAKPQVWLGVAILILAVVLRYASGLAAELFTMRGSAIGALIGLTVYYAGVRQVIHWWLPFTLAILSIPLPELLTQALALPLQFKASQMGASLLEMRNVPVLLTGNVIRLPGQELFVTEACSGLRSLTALISTAILMGAMLLRTPPARLVIVLLAVPIAILINGVRVFLTGFLVYFVSPELGTGFMHVTEGWLLFLVSLAALGAITMVAIQGEKWYFRRKENA
jgi:exosortase